ncbi:MAG: nuclear transport factor 2 family protein [Ktedonobacteraceae bacterium]|nr:nuclear transport factor 2 family protein [Ktedonobacteraceae bacterium]
MDETIARLVVQTYVDGWREGDRAKILSSLDEECVIIESYGPTYHGVEKVGCWIDTWFGGGNTVDGWEITSFYIAGETCFFEWVFACTYEGGYGSFEGASIAQLRKGKIVLLREYQTTKPLYEWEG